jgi:glycosyltransferase involved in cell wall biosynthesis
MMLSGNLTDTTPSFCLDLVRPFKKRNIPRPQKQYLYLKENKPMKFSVLLPTRNGGPYLANCMSSILDQSYEDLELVVSDNANTDETSEVIASFAGDPRLKAIRTEKPLSVIDNWNNALYASSGDYVLMIGDDDFLLPGYFKRMEAIIEKYDYPEGITYNGYRFIFPDSISGNQYSYYSDPYFIFGSDFKHEGFLESGKALSIVRDMFRFNVRVPLNTLPHLWSRKAIDRVEGDIFRPPYPDHFALNSLLLKAKTWVYVPEQLFVIGVTPKSYGHFVFSDSKQEEGTAYLGISSDFEGRLPGNDLVNNMNIWLNLLEVNHQEHLRGIKICRANYVRRQVHFWCSQYKYGAMALKDMLKLLGKLTLGDWLRLASSVWDRKSLEALWSLMKFSNKNKVDTFYYEPQCLEGISNIKEFSEWICERKSVEKR